MDKQPARLLNFGDFELDMRTGELRRHGLRIRLPEQSFQILSMLLERPGEVVLREEIRRKLWPNDTVVEFDHSINAAIKRLRNALAESAEEPRYIETLAKRGYRFVGPAPITPAVPQDAAAANNHDNLSGHTFSNYKVLEKLGSGGMGVVYRAEDLKLGRQVALKFLQWAVDDLSGPAIERFEREARTASAMNHPNICTIYGVDNFSGQPVIVMELLEGETLEARLQRGALKLDQALALARQIASALAEAHGKGVVHRDLKPANIMIGKSGGGAKVLDFGLAKLERRPSTDENTVTAEGAILGTVQYMSPEQVKGEFTDHRSDIFSFGLIVHELLSGKPAFQGVAAEIMAAILNDDPPELPDAVPSGVRRIVAHCLEKDPAKRFQSSADIGFDLDGVAQREVVASHPGGKRWWIVLAATTSLIAGALALTLYFTRQTPTNSVVRFSFAPPFKSNNVFIVMSPDGARFAFSGGSGIWLRSVDSLTAQKLPGTEGASVPAWSPDGGSFVFRRNGLHRMDFRGGQTTVQRLTSTADLGGGLAWSRQGVILFQPQTVGTGLYQVPAGGGTPSPATKLNPARQEITHRFPQFLPDGRHFIYWVWSALEENTGVYVGSLDQTEKPMDGPLVRTWRNARYAEPGYLLYLQGSTLVARRFDRSSRRFSGEPHPCPELIRLHDGTTGQALFSISDTGTLAYHEALPLNGPRIIVRDRGGNQLRAIEAPSGSARPSLDLLERNVVFDRADENTIEQLWKVDLERGTSLRLTASHDSNTFPIWSPDGLRVAFRSNRTGAFDVYAKNTTGAGEDEPLTNSLNMKTPTSWSNNGRYLAYFEQDPVTRHDIWVLPMHGDRKPIPFLKTEFREANGNFSPVADSLGNLWMAYQSDETGSFEIYLRSFKPDSHGGAAGASRLRISTGGGWLPRWRGDGREIFYFEGDHLMAVDVKLGNSPEIGVPHKLFQNAAGADSIFGAYSVFRDGKRFLFIEPAGEAPVPKINVVVNWIAGLAGK